MSHLFQLLQQSPSTSSAQGWITERAQGAPKTEPLREVAVMYLLFVVERGVFYLFAVGFNLRCQGHSYRQYSCTGARGQSGPTHDAFLGSACLSASLSKHACGRR